LHPETVTNIFWGLLLVWFGAVATTVGGNFGTTVNSPVFALGTGVLLILLNLSRTIVHLKLSPLTIGLGALLTIIYSPIVFLGFNIPFLPALLIILGIALIIGAIRTRKYY
jgi:hypothetical protein